MFSGREHHLRHHVNMNQQASYQLQQLKDVIKSPHIVRQGTQNSIISSFHR